MYQRVPVVEDDEAIGQAVISSLESHGYAVEWCTSGVAAQSVVEQAPPDLVLLDAGLPDIDGFTVCRRLLYANGTVTCRSCS